MPCMRLIPLLLPSVRREKAFQKSFLVCLELRSTQSGAGRGARLRCRIGQAEEDLRRRRARQSWCPWQSPWSRRKVHPFEIDIILDKTRIRNCTQAYSWLELLVDYTTFTSDWVSCCLQVEEEKGQHLSVHVVSAENFGQSNCNFNFSYDFEHGYSCVIESWNKSQVVPSSRCKTEWPWKEPKDLNRCFAVNWQLGSRRDLCEEKSTHARNSYLLQLASANAHQNRYFHVDLKSVIKVIYAQIHVSIHLKCSPVFFPLSVFVFQFYKMPHVNFALFLLLLFRLWTAVCTKNCPSISPLLAGPSW